MKSNPATTSPGALWRLNGRHDHSTTNPARRMQQAAFLLFFSPSRGNGLHATVTLGGEETQDPTWKALMSDKPRMQDLLAKWERGRGSMMGETSWAVPIGHRELVQVTGISPAPDGSRTVEYDWRWVADETGTLLRQSVPAADSFFDRPKKARATCRRWDDGWRCQLGMWTTAADGLRRWSRQASARLPTLSMMPAG